MSPFTIARFELVPDVEPPRKPATSALPAAVIVMFNVENAIASTPRRSASSRTESPAFKARVSSFFGLYLAHHVVEAAVRVDDVFLQLRDRS